jgi:hypothetical protein
VQPHVQPMPGQLSPQVQILVDALIACSEAVLQLHFFDFSILSYVFWFKNY